MSWWQKSLSYALCASLAIHLAVLLWKKPPHQDQEKHLQTPLSVVIVNSQSAIAPMKPTRLAQHDLNGGGTTDDRIATAVAPVNPGVAQKIEDLQQEQTRLLARAASEQLMNSTTVEGKLSKVQEALRSQEAEIAKRIEKEGQSPRKAIFTSTSAKSVVYAEYYNLMKHKVESYGTKFFPRYNNEPLYGSLIVSVSVGQNGKILTKPKVEKSSGNSELDRQALAIVNASAPFGKFPSKMKAQLDVIDWIATFNFYRGGEQTQLELNMQNHER